MMKIILSWGCIVGYISPKGSAICFLPIYHRNAMLSNRFAAFGLVFQKNIFMKMRTHKAKKQAARAARF
jgi:hypothetical protein